MAVQPPMATHPSNDSLFVFAFSSASTAASPRPSPAPITPSFDYTAGVVTPASLTGPLLLTACAVLSVAAYISVVTACVLALLRPHVRARREERDKLGAILATCYHPHRARTSRASLPSPRDPRVRRGSSAGSPPTTSSRISSALTPQSRRPPCPPAGEQSRRGPAAVAAAEALLWTYMQCCVRARPAV